METKTYAQIEQEVIDSIDNEFKIFEENMLKMSKYEIWNNCAKIHLYKEIRETVADNQLDEEQIELLYPYIGHILEDAFIAWTNNEIETLDPPFYMSILLALRYIRKPEPGDKRESIRFYAVEV